VALATSDASPVGARRIYLGPRVGFADAAVYDRYRMPAGSSGAGPALMQERETTVVVPPGAQWRVDEHMNLRVRLEDERGDAEPANASP
jgi:N-methylhydantoinase A/oxoprolinase/acetone carboxylase beta subunit